MRTELISYTHSHNVPRHKLADCDRLFLPMSCKCDRFSNYLQVRRSAASLGCFMAKPARGGVK